jgi:hypothetical protein
MSEASAITSHASSPTGCVGALQGALVLHEDRARGAWVKASAGAVPAFWLVLLGLHLPFGGLATTDPLVHLGSGVAYGLITAPALRRLLWSTSIASARRAGPTSLIGSAVSTRPA